MLRVAYGIVFKHAIVSRHDDGQAAECDERFMTCFHDRAKFDLFVSRPVRRVTADTHKHLRPKRGKKGKEEKKEKEEEPRNKTLSAFDCFFSKLLFSLSLFLSHWLFISSVE